jgi:hypothetical protein
MRTRVLKAVATAVVAATVIVAGGQASARPDGSVGAATGRHGVAVGLVGLDGAQEVPGPGDADGRGIFAYAAFGDHLCYVLTARKIEPAAMAHIHSGARGVAGPIVIGLEAPTGGLSVDCITAVDDSTPNAPDVLLRSELDAIVADPAAFYVNVHNAPFPAGAIRGQLR